MNANYKIAMAALAALVLAALTTVVSGNAALAQDSVRVRGTIESIDGPTYAIKARDGADLKVELAANAQIAAVTKASLADIKQGLFVGVTAMPQADGSLSAVEVHIFPEAMRGTGEGHYSWDLRPKSTIAYVKGGNSDLKPGAKVFIAAVKQPDGTLQGRAWRVGRDGVTPPM